MAKLPRAIQQQVEAVDAMYQPPAAQEPAAPPPAETPPVPAPTETPPDAPPQSQAPAPQGTPVEPSENAPEGEGELPAPPAKPSRSSQESWEQRYKTLQGLTNQNAADFKQRMAQERAQRESLERKIAEMEAAARAQPPKVDPQHTAEFGEDLVRMVHAVVQSYMGQNSSMLDSQVRNLDSKVQAATQEVSRAAEEAFLQRVEARIPDVKAINVDPDFLSWLAEPDPMYGVPRQVALDEAAKAHDVDRVARIFNAYKAMTTPAAAPAAPPPPSAPAPSARLEKQAAPRAGVTAPAPAPQAGAKRLFTSAEVHKFYDEVRRGLYRGKDAEYQRMEQEINQALAEGRISP